MIYKIQLIQILFFVFSFVTLFSQGVTNNIFAWRLERTSLSLVLLILNMIFFILGKIYGNLFNRIPLRLISYIFFVQSFLSIFLIPDIIVLNCIFTLTKSFLSGILSSTIFSLMSHKTERWKLKKYPIQIGIFISIMLVSNILVYILSRFKSYVTIIFDASTGYMIYKLSSNDIKIDHIIEDKDKLTNIKFIFNTFLNHVNGIIILIIQKKKVFIFTQMIYIFELLALIIFILSISKSVLFENTTTYYYICIHLLKRINTYIRNETIHNHIEHLHNKLEFLMIYNSLTNNKSKILIAQAVANKLIYANK